jgi:HAMP domain-containing protein
MRPGYVDGTSTSRTTVRHELIGAVDLAEAIGAVATDTAQEILSLATRLKRMLRALTR